MKKLSKLFMIYPNKESLFNKLKMIGKTYLEFDKMEVVYRPKTLNELDKIIHENKTNLTYQCACRPNKETSKWRENSS